VLWLGSRQELDWKGRESREVVVHGWVAIIIVVVVRGRKNPVVAVTVIVEAVQWKQEQQHFLLLHMLLPLL
jgi:hypothetical protein